MFLEKLFHKNKKVNEINPFPISDLIRFRNGDKTLDLTVKGSASGMVLNLKTAQARLEEVTGESSEEERLSAAKMFAASIFGDAQAEKLIEFYDNDPVACITACGEYFDQVLKVKIIKAQKK